MARIAMAPTDRSMPAVRMISVCPSGERADDRHLLQDERQRVRRGEARVEGGEDDERDDQHEERADRGVRVQQVLDALQWRVPAQGELLRGGGRWCRGGHGGLPADVGGG
jgi:hypothetical protein